VAHVYLTEQAQDEDVEVLTIFHSSQQFGTLGSDDD
jgi:hypothetical protein